MSQVSGIYELGKIICINMESSINQSLCSKCKSCIEVCPCNIIGISETNEVYLIPERKSICINCGQCMAVCSTKAIIVNGYSFENDFVDLPDQIVDYKKFMEFLANRRPVRTFQKKSLPAELLNQIVNSISYAPFGADPEKMNITIVNNRQKIESALPFIADFLDNIVKWIDNPIASFMIKRRNTLEKFNTIKNHLYPIAKLENYKLEFGDRITRNAPAIIIFHAKIDAEEHTNNSMIYATYVMLTALSLGLGASMIGIVPAAINKMKEVRDIFQIPKENEAIMSVIIGYPKYKYKRTIRRRNHKITLIE